MQAPAPLINSQEQRRQVTTAWTTKIATLRTAVEQVKTAAADLVALYHEAHTDYTPGQPYAPLSAAAQLMWTAIGYAHTGNPYEDIARVEWEARRLLAALDRYYYNL